MHMQTVQAIFAVAGGVVFVGLMLWWHYSRSDSLLRQWAERNGYGLVSQDHRYLVRGPFFWTTSRGQTVYRVTVEDEGGNRRSGWVRCGSWLLGLLSDQVEVRWDD
jgi:hypothetical protein